MCIKSLKAAVWLSILSLPPLTIAETMPTTLPPTSTIPPGSCLHEGQLYLNGANIQRDPYNCSSTDCIDGTVQYRDDECMFRNPVCYGRSEKVLGRCCPVCHDNKTTVPTTIPKTSIPPGFCLHNGKMYANGAEIEKDPNNCYGIYCEDGNMVAWDAECFFRTPYCAGKTEKVPGRCCPVCHNVTTVPPTPPADGCFVDGKVYANGQTVTKDPNNCFGSECRYGVVHSWEQGCYYPPNVCKDRWVNITGQCCKVCAMTTLPPETTSTAKPTCYLGNRRFSVGQRTNSDPCHVCTCASDGTEKCSNVTCNAVLDCEDKYRPVGDCCFTCGSSQMTLNCLLATFLLLISKWFKEV